MNTFTCVTLGCKVNQYETNAMRQALEDRKLRFVSPDAHPDLIIVNTCAVTGVSGRKSRQAIRKAKMDHPGALVVAAGCLAHLEENQLGKIADLVIGNHEKTKIIQILESRKASQIVSDISQVDSYEEIYPVRTDTRTRALVKIQDGCNNNCSFCIIPHVRGKSRSRTPRQIMEEAERLTQGGVKELVMTGIHLDSYGLDLEDTCLADILEQLHEIDGLERIRLSSLEPGIVDKAFLKRLAALSRLCPHFHLSIQSGCDETLRRMNRNYNVSHFRDAVNGIRETFPSGSVTTDIIVGFPGETEEEFRESYAFVEDMRFSRAHVFRFSPRKGTAAFHMPDQVESRIQEERSHRMMSLCEDSARLWMSRWKGKTVQVLVEQISRRRQGWVEGYTPHYMKVVFPGDRGDMNSFKDVIIADTDGQEAIGSCTEKDECNRIVADRMGGKTNER